MDAESLLTNETSRNVAPRRSTTATVILFLATCASFLLGTLLYAQAWNNDDTGAEEVLLGGPLEIVPSSSVPPALSMEAWSVGKKIHPPHPKKLHHGEVLYTVVQDPDMGRYYKREFLIPCGYGLLVFNIAPADESMPYALDVFDDGYVYSDNGGLCLLYPSYRAHQNDTEPFWMPDDPTSFNVPLGHELTKISHRINSHPHTKDTASDKKVQAKGGDYLIMAKHDFYTPQYYRQLKSLVNSWKIKGEEWEDDMDSLHVMLEEALMQEMFASEDEEKMEVAAW